jgi:Tc5 transposase DNA-binding domain
MLRVRSKYLGTASNRPKHFPCPALQVLHSKLRQNRQIFNHFHSKSSYFIHTMPSTNSEIEEHVLEACEWLQTQKKPYFSKAARKYGVHKDRVRRRFLEKTASLRDNGGHNKHLNDEEDRALCAYIDFADEIGLSIREKTLIVAANSILRKHYPNSSPVSKMWASRWLSRHPEYKMKYRKPLAVIRKNTHDIKGLKR